MILKPYEDDDHHDESHEDEDDDHPVGIELECPECGEVIEEAVATGADEFTCPSCGTEFTLDEIGG